MVGDSNAGTLCCLGNTAGILNTFGFKLQKELRSGIDIHVCFTDTLKLRNEKPEG